MSRLNKTLAVLGMLLFFVVGAVAVSLAHDAPSTGPVHTNELRRALKYSPAQVDRYTLRIGMALRNQRPAEFLPACFARVSGYMLPFA